MHSTDVYKRQQLSRQSLEKAHENERQAMERYNEGEISIVEVIEAQTYRQNAEIKMCIRDRYGTIRKIFCKSAV